MTQNLAGSLAPIWLEKSCQNVSGAAATQVLPQRCQQIWQATARMLVQNCRGRAARPWRMPKLSNHNHAHVAQNRRDSRQQLRRCWPLAVFLGCSGAARAMLAACFGRLRRFRQDSGAAWGCSRAALRRLRPFARNLAGGSGGSLAAAWRSTQFLSRSTYLEIRSTY